MPDLDRLVFTMKAANATDLPMSEDMAAQVRQMACALEKLLIFHRQVRAAAGDMDGLPDEHAFELTWWFGDEREEGEPSVNDLHPEERSKIITAGMIRRAIS